MNEFFSAYKPCSFNQVKIKLWLLKRKTKIENIPKLNKRTIENQNMFSSKFFKGRVETICFKKKKMSKQKILSQQKRKLVSSELEWYDPMFYHSKSTLTSAELTMDNFNWPCQENMHHQTMLVLNSFSLSRKSKFVDLTMRNSYGSNILQNNNKSRSLKHFV